MKKLSNNELANIIGGEGIASTLVSALSKLVNVFVDVGRNIGSGIRRITTNNYCQMK